MPIKTETVIVNGSGIAFLGMQNCGRSDFQNRFKQNRGFFRFVFMAELPHLIYACIYHIAFEFGRAHLGCCRQGKLSQNALR